MLVEEGDRPIGRHVRATGGTSVLAVLNALETRPSRYFRQAAKVDDQAIAGPALFASFVDLKSNVGLGVMCRPSMKIA